MTTWRYFDKAQTVVYRVLDDGGWESHLIGAGCIQAWLAAGNTPLPYAPPVVDPKEQARADLAATDKEMARIAEDLIQTLISKDLITESDIPQSAQDKMARRAKLRSRLA